MHTSLSTVFSLFTKLMPTGMVDNRDMTTIEIQAQLQSYLNFLHALMIESDPGAAMLVIKTQPFKRPKLCARSCTSTELSACSGAFHITISFGF